MEGALIILAVTVVVGVVLFVHHRLTEPKSNGTPKTQSVEAMPQSECCGMHITCEKDSLATLSTDIIYYDDEELDAYAGIAADNYSDEQIEEFREVLLTLLPQDIAPWARSLSLRGITLPEIVKEELLLIVREERQKQTH